MTVEADTNQKDSPDYRLKSYNITNIVDLGLRRHFTDYETSSIMAYMILNG